MQDFLAIIIVILAAAFLARRGWQRVANRRAGACGACANCSASDTMELRKLVMLSPNFRGATATSTRADNEF
jgi:hypothetical protein